MMEINFNPDRNQVSFKIEFDIRKAYHSSHFFTTNMRLGKTFWLTLSLFNLCIVAFFGLTLRTKIIFSIPMIDYRNFQSAHSHFAFGGWVGLSLFTLLVYEILPASFSRKLYYQVILGIIELSSLGMAFSFPFAGYNALSITFSSLYIFGSFAFAWVFIRDLVAKDLLSYKQDRTVRLLSITSVASLVISSIGPLGLVYILITHSGNSLLYRDSIYTFLHFQYNGFFTTAIVALFLNLLAKKGMGISKDTRLFAVFLCLSIIPSLFLSLLWHNLDLFYWIAAAGSAFILAAVFYLARFLFSLRGKTIFTHRLSFIFLVFSALSLILKLIMNVGTLIPSLGNAVYGDRPVIIGFLHLVFLGFVSFYLLGSFIASNMFSNSNTLVRFPFIVFACGIFANETLLMLQGLGILFKTNSYIFNWLLWGAAIMLFTGSVMIFISRLTAIRNKNSDSDATAISL
jgi:hypothetical protein